MINTKKLTEKDIGRWVEYENFDNTKEIVELNHGIVSVFLWFITVIKIGTIIKIIQVNQQTLTI